MADIKSIQVEGVDYAIKDESARSSIGDLSKLTTEAKNDLVSALNELSAGAGSGSGSGPIQRIESLDESNLLNLRDLETGSYVLYGYFRPYAGASNYLPFDNLLVNVFHVAEGSHLFEFSTANSEVNFIEILVDSTVASGFTYSRTAINMLELNGLIGKLGNLDELDTTEKGSVVAAINEVAASGGGGSDGLPLPESAAVGQLIAVSEVDESGKVTKTETIDIPAMQGVNLVDYDANVRAVNHRGYSLAAPENTLPAYMLSKKYGFTYVEADVSFTSDGVPVLLHDSTIDRTSSGSGSISALTYAEVSQYDFGSWKSADYAGTKIPTFAQFIKLCKSLCLHPYIELKNNGAYTEAQIQELVAIVEANGMRGKVTWISFSSAFLGYVKTADPDARLGYLVSSITSDTITTAESLRTDSNEVFLDSSDFDADAIALCIAADIPLEIWTINGKSVIENMDGYITGVTSDSIHAGRHLFNTAAHPVVTDALINIAMGSTGGSNNGTGGADYAATYEDVNFLGDASGFEISGTGYLTVPTDFMTGADPWTIAFTIDAYTPSSANYSRFARGNNDVPSLFYTKSVSAAQAKLAQKSAQTNNVEVINNSFVSLSSNAILLNIPQNIATTFVFRNNGEYISLWINGIETLREEASRYTSDKFASTFSIGDNAGAGYTMSYLKCSMLKAWNRALTDAEISIIS